MPRKNCVDISFQKSFHSLKPIFFIEKESGCFASDDINKTLQRCPSNKIRQSAFDSFLQIGFIPSNLTFLQNVRRLYPQDHIKVTTKIEISQLQEKPKTLKSILEEYAKKTPFIYDDKTAGSKRLKELFPKHRCVTPLSINITDIEKNLPTYIKKSFVLNGHFKNFIDFLSFQGQPPMLCGHGHRWLPKSQYIKGILNNKKIFRKPPYAWNQNFYFDQEYNKTRQLCMIHDTCANLEGYDITLPFLQTQDYAKAPPEQTNTSILKIFFEKHQKELSDILYLHPGLLEFFYAQSIQHIFYRKNTPNNVLIKWRLLLYALWYHNFVIKSKMHDSIFKTLQEVT